MISPSFGRASAAAALVATLVGLAGCGTTDRIKLHVYPGGHMLYTRPESRAALAHDVAALYAGNP